MPSTRLFDFDTWRPGYGLAIVSILRAGTDNLADVYTDENLTAAAANPQTLLQNVEGEVSYGKWSQPLYVGEAVELKIDSVDQTGVIRPPITTLDDQDASEAVVTVTGGSQAIALDDHLARRIDVRDFGVFLEIGSVGESSATNGATLQAAIAAAAAAGGGYVEAPAGTYSFSPITLPEGVVVRGADREATTLRSTTAAEIATIAGPRAGFSRITLDGVSLAAGSVGVAAVGKDEIVLDDVLIKRFAVGIRCRGGENSLWRDLFISDCASGALLRGDTDTGDSGTGKRFRKNRWLGGRVELCSVVGIQIENVDADAEHNTIETVEFDTNTGTALKIVGAEGTRIVDPVFTGNTVDFEIEDGADEGQEVFGFTIEGGLVSGGEVELSGTLENVIFDKVTFDDVDITLTLPGNNVLAKDCREINDTTLAGVPTRWMRLSSTNRGETFGLTTNNGATKAWSIPLDPGQKCYLEAKVIGRQRNGTDTAFYHVAVSAGRPGSTLAYDTQTGNFTLGATLTGATTGATARIIADSDGGTTGTLTLQDIIGEFADDEIISDGVGGSATANGTLTPANAALIGSVTAIRAAQEVDADYNATFVANGTEIELQVTGDTSETVEWTVHVEAVKT